jgi:aspartyl/asparaginyl beta-hydroxylase (cupin superfamily)
MAQFRSAEWEERNGETGAATQSWSNVLALAAGMDDLPAPMHARLEEARAFVQRGMAALAADIDAGFEQDFAERPPADVRRFRAGIDHLLGRRRIYANACSGMHYPFLPADEFFDRAHFPWMAELETRTGAIRAELQNLLAQGPDLLRPYVRQERGTPDNVWTPLDQSLDWGACFLWEYGVRNDPVCDLCPETVTALEKLPRSDINGRAPSAFFSLLRPGAHIPAHSGVTNIRAIVHLPLIVPPGCAFRVGGETRIWEEGQAFAFDDTIEHEAWNNSDELRSVLIFDVWNPHLTRLEQDVIARYYAASDATGYNARRGE